MDEKTHTLENWFKLTFRLIVGDHWQKVSPIIVGGDTTYRWCREMILNSLRTLEGSSNILLSSAIANIKGEIWNLRTVYPGQERESLGDVSTWETTSAMAFDLIGNLPKVADKLTAIKLAILSKAFSVREKKDALALKTKLCSTFLKLKSIVGEQTASQELVEAFFVFADYLNEYNIDTSDDVTRMGARTTEASPWQPPDAWCFGDYGDNDGQLEYPVDVLVTETGEFLVLEENSKGPSTVQRLQLFDERGRYLKTLLQRGVGGVTAMSDMALEDEGHVVVSLKDENNIGRVNVYDMQGTCIRVMDVPIPNPEFPPFFTSVAVDKEGRIVVVEHNEKSIHVYGKDGKFLFKFGKAGLSSGDGIFDNIYSLDCSQQNEIYVCDPYQRVQVFDKSGKFLRSFKPCGTIPSHLIVMEEKQLVYGINRDVHALEMYSLDGTKVLGRFGGFGNELGKLWRPMGIAMMKEGRIAVAERESHRIQVLKT